MESHTAAATPRSVSAAATPLSLSAAYNDDGYEERTKDWGKDRHVS